MLESAFTSMQSDFRDWGGPKVSDIGSLSPLCSTNWFLLSSQMMTGWIGWEDWLRISRNVKLQNHSMGTAQAVVPNINHSFIQGTSFQSLLTLVSSYSPFCHPILMHLSSYSCHIKGPGEKEQIVPDVNSLCSAHCQASVFSGWAYSISQTMTFRDNDEVK